MRKSRLFIFVFALILLFCTLDQGNAKITKEYDEFEKTYTYTSSFEQIGPWFAIDLIAEQEWKNKAIISIMLADTSNIRDTADYLSTVSRLLGRDLETPEEIKNLLNKEWAQQDYCRIAKCDAKMKVNDEIIDISCFGTDMKTKMAGIMAISVGSAGYLLTKSTIKKIKKARHITIRIYLSEGPDITWKVPKHVIKEWKELLHMAFKLGSP